MIHIPKLDISQKKDQLHDFIHQTNEHSVSFTVGLQATFSAFKQAPYDQFCSVLNSLNGWTSLDLPSSSSLIGAYRARWLSPFSGQRKDMDLCSVSSCG